MASKRRRSERRVDDLWMIPYRYDRTAPEPVRYQHNTKIVQMRSQKKKRSLEEKSRRRRGRDRKFSEPGVKLTKIYIPALCKIEFIENEIQEREFRIIMKNHIIAHGPHFLKGEESDRRCEKLPRSSTDATLTGTTQRKAIT